MGGGFNGILPLSWSCHRLCLVGRAELTLNGVPGSPGGQSVARQRQMRQTEAGSSSPVLLKSGGLLPGRVPDPRLLAPRPLSLSRLPWASSQTPLSLPGWIPTARALFSHCLPIDDQGQLGRAEGKQNNPRLVHQRWRWPSLTSGEAHQCWGGRMGEGSTPSPSLSKIQATPSIFPSLWSSPPTPFPLLPRSPKSPSLFKLWIAYAYCTLYISYTSIKLFITLYQCF